MVGYDPEQQNTEQTEDRPQTAATLLTMSFLPVSCPFVVGIFFSLVS